MTEDGNVTKKSLTVSYEGKSYEFRIPSFKDRMDIAGHAEWLHRKSFPDPLWRRRAVWNASWEGLRRLAYGG